MSANKDSLGFWTVRRTKEAICSIGLRGTCNDPFKEILDIVIDSAFLDFIILLLKVQYVRIGHLSTYILIYIYIISSVSGAANVVDWALLMFTQLAQD